MSSEMQAMVDTFGWGWDDLEWVTLNAMKSAFGPSTTGSASSTSRSSPAMPP